MNVVKQQMTALLKTRAELQAKLKQIEKRILRLTGKPPRRSVGQIRRRQVTRFR